MISLAMAIFRKPPQNKGDYYLYRLPKEALNGGLSLVAS